MTINATTEHAEVLRGDIQIRQMWQRQIDTNIDVKVTDTYAKSYLNFSLEIVF